MAGPLVGKCARMALLRGAQEGQSLPTRIRPLVPATWRGRDEMDTRQIGFGHLIEARS